VATLRSLSDGSRLRKKRAWASPGRCDQPVAPGLAPMLRGEPIASSGLRKEFFPGTYWHCSLWVFCLPLQHSAPPSSSSCFGLCSCLLLLHHQDGLSCSAPGGRKAFFPPPWASKALWGFFAFLCTTQHGHLPGLLSALLPCSVPAALTSPSGLSH